MEIGEAVAVGEKDVKEGQDAPTCEHQTEEGKIWKARVNGLGEDGKTCSGDELYRLMSKRGEEKHLEKGLGVIPKKKEDAHWAKEGLNAVTGTSFPVQAHHLIPKNFLPKHDVCRWLCKKSGKLTGDTFYNTDHPNNGYCMPYASPLKDWKDAKDNKEKTNIAFAVMKKTGIQMHQGSHARDLDQAKVKKRLGEEEFPEVHESPGSSGDELEENEIHGAGYLNAIKKWLNAVYGRVAEHVETCESGCAKAEGGKIRMRPLEDTVRLMNRVSYIAKVFLDLNIIHACPYGAAYAAHKDLLAWDPNLKRFYVRKEADARIVPLTKCDIEQALAKTPRK